MKRYDELTPDQQAKAVQRFTGEILTAVVEGAVRFNDDANGDGLQKAIDKAMQKAERMQTPWFAGEYVMDARYRPMKGHITEADGLWPVREALESMARCDAEDAMYLEPGERAVPGLLNEPSVTLAG